MLPDNTAQSFHANVVFAKVEDPEVGNEVGPGAV